MGGPVSQEDLTRTYGDIVSGQYKTIAASQTDAALGAAGAIGDWLCGVLIIPAAADCGAVSIKDGSGSAIPIFQGGGTVALPSPASFFIALGCGIKSQAGGWSITTGAGVSALAVGRFTET